MKCEICNRGMPEGVNLHRQNEKGVTGIWRCDDCNMKEVAPEIMAIYEALQPGSAKDTTKGGCKQ